MRVKSPSFRCVLVLVGFLAFVGHQAAAQEKIPLDHDVYEIWNRVNDRVIAGDGSTVAVSYGPENQDPTLDVYSTDGQLLKTIARGTTPSFSADGDFLVFLIKPSKADTRKAKIDGKKKDDLPTDSIGVLNLGTSRVEKRGNVKSFKLPEDDGAFVAFLHANTPEDSSASKQSTTPETDEKKEDSPKDSVTKNGLPLTLLNLTSGQSHTYDKVEAFEFDASGGSLYFIVSDKDEASDGVYRVDTATGVSTAIMAGDGDYEQLAVAENGGQIAFLSNRDDLNSDAPQYSLYLHDSSAAQPVVIADSTSNGMVDGWSVSKNRGVDFSESGRRVYFGTAPTPAPDDTTNTIPDDEKVVVDVWHWQDARLQPMQAVQLDRDKKKSYKAVVFTDGSVRGLVQLETMDRPTVVIGDDGDSPTGIANTNIPYRIESSWDFPGYNDVYLVDISTGSATRILKRIQSSATLSPDAGFATYWDRSALTWMAFDVKSAKLIDLGHAIETPLQNELHDWPYKANPYGGMGWSENDGTFLIYDKFDIWSVDPRKPDKPQLVTDGVGRRNNIRFRYSRLDPEERFVANKQALLLSAFNYESKSAGFYRDVFGASTEPSELLFSGHRYSGLSKAKDVDVVVLTRESFVEFPDIWKAKTDLTEMRKLTTLNPQQSSYRWGTSELVTWTSLDGMPLQGLLYKPDNFDRSTQYPMMVYFYEKNSDLLHRHHAPEPHRSTINISFYVSRGYVVFVPDIVYKTGYPGESAMNSVMPGVTNIVADGYVDPLRIGVQGHSWGGYQIAYMVTRTNLFRAAEAGAPVANMVSAYGGIRWGSGMSRMFQYERTQSRIGGSLWEYPRRYLENSPIFRIDDVQTPLLIMHNDQDAAVPWYQGIELFVALRRLNKPAWMINYNGEPHWPTKYQNKRDWAIRMQQFFDYYLLSSPQPVWMRDGVPAVEKGGTLGLELTKESDRR